MSFRGKKKEKSGLDFVDNSLGQDAKSAIAMAIGNVEFKESVLFAGWVVKKHKRSSKSEERLIVVTQYHLMSFSKQTLGGIKLKRKGHFFNLTSVIKSSNDVKFHFKDFDITLELPSAEEIRLLVRRSVSLITQDLPSSTGRVSTFVTDSGSPINDDKNLPPLSPLGGFREIYLAISAFYNVPASTSFLIFLDNLIKYPSLSMTEGENELNLIAAANAEKASSSSTSTIVVKYIIEALRHNIFFTHITLSWKAQYNRHTLLDDISAMVVTNTALISLSLKDMLLDKGWGGLSSSFKTSAATSKLSILDLSGNSLRDAGILELCSGFALLPNLSSLDVADCEITSKGLADFCTMLHTTPSLGLKLTALNLSKNKLGKNGGEALVRWLENKHSQWADDAKPVMGLKTLLLGGTEIDVGPVAVSLREGAAPLLVLDISGCKLNSDNAQSLSKMVVVSSTLNELDISGSSGADELFRSLLRGLSNNNKLSNVTLDVSRIEVVSSDIVFSVLSSSNNLTTVIAENVKVKSKEGTSVMLDNIFKISSLKRLHICGMIKSASSDAFSVTSKYLSSPNLKLTALHIDGCSDVQLGKDIIPLIQILEKNNTITELNISGHYFCSSSSGHEYCGSEASSGARALGKLITENKIIASLMWDGSGAGIGCISYFAQCLESNKSLSAMSYNAIDFNTIRSKNPSKDALIRMDKAVTRVREILRTNDIAQHPERTALIEQQQQQRQQQLQLQQQQLRQNVTDSPSAAAASSSSSSSSSFSSPSPPTSSFSPLPPPPNLSTTGNYSASPASPSLGGANTTGGDYNYSYLQPGLEEINMSGAGAGDSSGAGGGSNSGMKNMNRMSRVMPHGVTFPDSYYGNSHNFNLDVTNNNNSSSDLNTLKNLPLPPPPPPPPSLQLPATNTSTASTYDSSATDYNYDNNYNNNNNNNYNNSADSGYDGDSGAEIERLKLAILNASTKEEVMDLRRRLEIIETCK